MSLVDSIKSWYENESYPPDGRDLDYDVNDEETDTVTELVSEKDLDLYARWGTWFENVYKRDDEFVAIRDCRPATEMQDWGDYGAPEIYRVTPVTETITVTNYVKAD